MTQSAAFAIALAIGLSVLFAVPSAQAAAPGTISAQGMLVNGAGAPVTGVLNLTFKLFGSASGGTALWSGAVSSVPVEGGVFSVELGPFGGTPGLFDGAALWLETAVQGESPLPRQPLLSVPFAFTADRASNLACTGCIATAALADDSVTPAKVSFNYAGSDAAGGAATTAKALSCTGCVNATHLADGSIGSSKVSFAYAAGASVGGNALAAQALSCTGCVSSTHIASGAVGSGHLASSAVGTTHLQSASVTGAKIAAGAVSSSHVDFTYAGSSSKGGPASSAAVALDVNCTGCIASSEIASVAASKVTAGAFPSGNFAFPGGVVLSGTATAPHASAALDIDSVSKGFLLPRMTQAQRNAIASPAAGLQVFNLTSGCLDIWMGAAWKSITCQCDSTPNAAFGFSPGQPATGAAVTFTPATLSGVTYQWTFSGGSPPTSTATSPQVTWGSGGSYSAGLTVTNGAGCSASTSQQVTVSSCGSSNGSKSFAYTGSVQQWVVPACVTSVTVDARGAKGGTSGGAGGAGGRVVATLAVTPGETLSIHVGGMPSPNAAAGYNGGGAGVGTGSGGGGATDIRRGGAALGNRILVAGGGGGGAQGPGGAGGGLTGGMGSTPGNGSWAMGGTQSAGGAGGMYNNGSCSPGASWAQSGSLGTGGAGKSNSSCCCYGTGGGGGYYGGGGMQINGAGGGSSYVTTSGSSAITHTQGYNAANGSIAFTW